MAEGERRAPRKPASGEIVHEMQVGVASAGTAYAHDDLPWTCFRFLHLLEDRLGLPIEKA